jgi:hypothetical protein
MTPEQQKEIDRARAFGLLLGACTGMTYRVAAEDREKIERIIEEARKLWGE